MRRVLSVDPGAERCGWAIIDTPYQGPPEPKLIASGILGLEREKKAKGYAKDEDYQVYKLRLVSYLSVKVPALLHDYGPTAFVNETQPAVGGGNFIAATQSELAKTSATIFQTWAYARLLTVAQIGATTIKAAIGGGKSATKPKVRNGVIMVFPEIAVELKKETTGERPVWDRSDGIATGLAYIGVKVKP